MNLNKSINSLLKFENSSLNNRGALLIALNFYKYLGPLIIKI
jgi:hypothetical protein